MNDILNNIINKNNIWYNTLLTINIVCNDFLTLNSINYIVKYINLGDLIAILGSIDFVSGSVDLVRTSYILSIKPN